MTDMPTVDDDKEFSIELDRRLVQGLIEDRETTLEEFAALGIPRIVALKRARTLGLSKDLLRSLKIFPGQLEVRLCLGCEARFLSRGAHNRFCNACRNKKGERRGGD